MVGCPKGSNPFGVQRLLLFSGHRADARNGQGFLWLEGRQQLGELMGQSAFAATRRPHQQQVMPACCGQCQGLAGLPWGIDGPRGLWRRAGPVPADPLIGAGAVELFDQLVQIGGGVHHQVGDERGFIGITRWHHQGISPFTGRQFGHRQHAAAGAQPPIQPQFPGAPKTVEPRAIQLTAGHQQGQGDG